MVALNHFGSASIGKTYVGNVVKEACEGNQNASQVIAAYDILEVWIPRGAFDFDRNASDN